MRVPTAQGRRRGFRVRGWIIAGVILLVILLFSLRGLAGFYTDFLWFDSVGQGGTWRGLLTAKVVPALVFTVVFFVIMLANLMIADWIFAGLVIVLLVTAVAHYLNGGIRFQSPFQRVTPQVKAHLSVILAVMALVKTAQYYLDRFNLDFSQRGVVTGASYTDVKAQLPALNLLIFISIVAAGLFIWNIWRRGWVLPIIAVGLWGFVSIVIGTIYPAGVQKFRVEPNEVQNE